MQPSCDHVKSRCREGSSTCHGGLGLGVKMYSGEDLNWGSGETLCAAWSLGSDFAISFLQRGQKRHPPRMLRRKERILMRRRRRVNTRMEPGPRPPQSPGRGPRSRRTARPQRERRPPTPALQPASPARHARAHKPRRTGRALPRA